LVKVPFNQHLYTLELLSAETAMGVHPTVQQTHPEGLNATDFLSLRRSKEPKLILIGFDNGKPYVSFRFKGLIRWK
jgi:hypothetical protein